MSFNDGRCPKCKRRVSWMGKVTDRPPCVCGHQVDLKELEETEAEMQRFRDTLFEDDDNDDDDSGQPGDGQAGEGSPER